MVADPKLYFFKKRKKSIELCCYGSSSPLIPSTKYIDLDVPPAHQTIPFMRVVGDILRIINIIKYDRLIRCGILIETQKNQLRVVGADRNLATHSGRLVNHNIIRLGLSSHNETVMLTRAFLCAISYTMMIHQIVHMLTGIPEDERPLKVADILNIGEYTD